MSYGELDQFKELVRALASDGSINSTGSSTSSPTDNSKVTEHAEVTEEKVAIPLTAEDIAAAVIKMYQKKQPLFPELAPLDTPKETFRRSKCPKNAAKKSAAAETSSAKAAAKISASIAKNRNA